MPRRKLFQKLCRFNKTERLSGKSRKSFPILMYLFLSELQNNFFKLWDICGTKFELTVGRLWDILIVRLNRKGLDTYHERGGNER